MSRGLSSDTLLLAAFFLAVVSFIPKDLLVREFESALGNYSSVAESLPSTPKVEPSNTQSPDSHSVCLGEPSQPTGFVIDVPNDLSVYQTFNNHLTRQLGQNSSSDEVGLLRLDRNGWMVTFPVNGKSTDLAYTSAWLPRDHQLALVRSSTAPVTIRELQGRGVVVQAAITGGFTDYAHTHIGSVIVNGTAVDHTTYSTFPRGAFGLVPGDDGGKALVFGHVSWESGGVVWSKEPFGPAGPLSRVYQGLQAGPLSTPQRRLSGNAHGFDEDFLRQRAARSVLAFRPHCNFAAFIAFPSNPGISLYELEAWATAAGFTHLVFLDGGGSTALFHKGKFVLPQQEAARPLGGMLILIQNKEG